MKRRASFTQKCVEITRGGVKSYFFPKYSSLISKNGTISVASYYRNRNCMCLHCYHTRICFSVYNHDPERLRARCLLNIFQPIFTIVKSRSFMCNRIAALAIRLRLRVSISRRSRFAIHNIHISTEHRSGVPLEAEAEAEAVSTPIASVLRSLLFG